MASSVSNPPQKIEFPLSRSEATQACVQLMHEIWSKRMKAIAIGNVSAISGNAGGQAPQAVKRVSKSSELRSSTLARTFRLWLSS